MSFTKLAPWTNYPISLTRHSGPGRRSIHLPCELQPKAPWYSGHGLQLLHRQSRFDSHSTIPTWQVNEPSPGSTHAL